MLWRPAYETRVLRGTTLPPLFGQNLEGERVGTPLKGALVGAFDPRALGELGIWRRLFEEAFPQVFLPTVLVKNEWSPRECRHILDATPPALRNKLLLADDPTGLWTSIVEPDRPERGFSAIVEAELLMIGLPTEESWDEFRETLRSKP